MKYSFEKYCKDYKNIENYERAKADNFICWCCHHRLETHNSDGKIREVDILAAELKALNMYYNRPASELIFLLSNNALCKVSNITKKKMSEAKKGKKLSEETLKKMSDANKDKHWYNNGKENKYCYECPDGFVSGMLKRK